jgi:predicted secreted protein
MHTFIDEVHRQLTLSPRFSQIVGVDDTTDSQSIHYMYDYARGITARELGEIGGALRSSSPLFRFIVSEVLESFIEFEERCTFSLRGKVDCTNIMVAEAGTSIKLCRLPLGDELSSFSNGLDVALFHARRESELVHAFGTIIAELLLGPSGESGHAPPNRGSNDDGVSNGSGGAIYDQEVARAGVHCTPNEKFTILLESDTSKGYVWDTPVIQNDDRSTVPIISFQGMDPRGSGSSSGTTTFAIQFSAVQTGSCTVELTRKRPWDDSISRESAMIIKVAVHERGMDPSYSAVFRACTEGYRDLLESLERESGASSYNDNSKNREITERRVLREPWQRQPTLRELRQHPLLSCSAARDTPEVDQLITAFERHVDYV